MSRKKPNIDPILDTSGERESKNTNERTLVVFNFDFWPI